MALKSVALVVVMKYLSQKNQMIHWVVYLGVVVVVVIAQVAEIALLIRVVNEIVL